MIKKGGKEYIHTVTRLGTVSIPIPLRRKYNIAKGSKIRFVDTNNGIQLIPLISLKNLFGAERDKANTINSIAREILNQR
ncbi:MAG: AbrB/MazE/SpoVT family DNA-binding domain-containing protein [Nitrososphaerales archaeon]